MGRSFSCSVEVGLNTGSRLSSLALFGSDGGRSVNLPSGALQPIDSKRESRVSLMREIIASLDGCLSSPQHTSTENINSSAAAQRTPWRLERKQFAINS